MATVLLICGLMIGGAIFGSLVTSKSYARVNACAGITSARAMVTLEASTGRIMYSHNADQKLPMASTTKILTAITVIENVANLDDEVKVNDKAIGIEGTSIYIQKGESLSVRELLLGLMLRSGNDCATALAYHVSGSEEKFAQLMNETAWKAGARNSNFVNAHGLDEEGHLTTARDLGLISAYAMRNDVFRDIVATKDIRIEGELAADETNPRMLANKNRLLRSNADIVGIKTGFTSKAGRCYVGAMRDNGMTVICVVLNCGPMFPESEALMERALNEFYMYRVLSSEQVITPTNKQREHNQAMVAQDFYYPIRPGEEGKFDITINEHHVVVHFDGQRVHHTKII